MRYIVDKSQTNRIELPPEDGAADGAEPGWVELKRLSAGDLRQVDRACQKAGIAVGSINGVLLLLERSVVEWSLPLPVTPSSALRDSLDRLSVDVVNLLGNAMTEELPLTEEQRADLLERRSEPTASGEMAPV